MQPGSNGPPVLNGGSNNYDRAICFDAPVAYDTGEFARADKTLAQYRTDLLVRLGYAAMAANPPPGMKEELNSYLDDAQRQLYQRYSELHTERWWAWQLEAGKRFYDIPIDCTKALNARRITWAGIADNGGRALRTWASSTAFPLGIHVMPTAGNGFEYEVTVAGTMASSEPAWPTTEGELIISGTVTMVARAAAAQRWLPLVQGINPLDFTSDEPGLPTHFDLRQYVELWPSPDKPYILWLRGHMGLRRFNRDTDIPTIDGHAVFLFALALAKAHRQQPDAQNYAQMANRYIRDLIAGSHGLKRHVPPVSTAGMKHDADGVMPMPRATWR